MSLFTFFFYLLRVNACTLLSFSTGVFSFFFLGVAVDRLSLSLSLSRRFTMYVLGNRLAVKRGNRSLNAQFVIRLKKAICMNYIKVKAKGKKSCYSLSLSLSLFAFAVGSHSLHAYAKGTVNFPRECMYLSVEEISTVLAASSFRGMLFLLHTVSSRHNSHKLNPRYWDRPSRIQKHGTIWCR